MKVLQMSGTAETTGRSHVEPNINELNAFMPSEGLTMPIPIRSMAIRVCSLAMPPSAQAPHWMLTDDRPAACWYCASESSTAFDAL